MTEIEIQNCIKRMEMRIAELGWSKEEFYNKSGISSASYSQWNTGVHKPTKKKLAQAAASLGISREYLLTGEGQKESRPEIRDGRAAEFIDLFNRLTPEEQERELAYLRSRAGE